MHPGIVINIGDFKMKVKNSRYHSGECQHLNVEHDANGETFVCVDCLRSLTAMAVFKTFIKQYERADEKLRREREEVEAARGTILHLIAAKAAETAWRNRSMLPTCPHCQRGIAPADGFGKTLISKAIEMRRRESERGKA